MIPPYLQKHIVYILNEYKGEVPLSDYLKKYFKSHPEAGSRDRRFVNEATYNFYRCAKGLVASAEDTLLARAESALQLVRGGASTLLPGYSFNPELLLPPGISLSTGVERKDWLNSMLHQPALFLRIRNSRDRVEVALRQKGISYEFINDTALRLANGANVEQVLSPGHYVVQDASSQATGDYFQPRKGEKWWDCCSGAGGKSLLLADKLPGVTLTVSDKRSTILRNLTERFKRYGLPMPQTMVADVSDPWDTDSTVGDKKFDRIICDVPCSGSGTWARTPENLYFFNPESIAGFHETQFNVARNAARYLLSGGLLYYITCSVFRSENEDVVTRLTEQSGLLTESQNLINGIDRQADCMFIAVLKKP